MSDKNPFGLKGGGEGWDVVDPKPEPRAEVRRYLCQCEHSIQDHSYEDGTLKPWCDVCCCKAFVEAVSDPRAESGPICLHCGCAVDGDRDKLCDACLLSLISGRCSKPPCEHDLAKRAPAPTPEPLTCDCAPNTLCDHQGWIYNPDERLAEMRNNMSKKAFADSVEKNAPLLERLAAPEPSAELTAERFYRSSDVACPLGAKDRTPYFEFAEAYAQSLCRRLEAAERERDQFEELMHAGLEDYKDAKDTATAAHEELRRMREALEKAGNANGAPIAGYASPEAQLKYHHERTNKVARIIETALYTQGGTGEKEKHG